MEASLKTWTAHVESLGCDVELRQMNATTEIELIEARREIGSRPNTAQNIRFAAIACAGCVVGWEGKTAEDVLNENRMEVVLDIAAEIMTGPRGDDRKNSESVPSGDSSSD